jgi:hypothetical protein
MNHKTRVKHGWHQAQLVTLLQAKGRISLHENVLEQEKS